jgi:hypothetical protein
MTGDVRFRYLKNDVNRHGKLRYYVRVPGKKMIRLQVDRKDDPEFSLAYAAALNGKTWYPAKARPKPTLPTDKPLPGSLRELCVRYYAYLAEEKQLTEGTKYTRRKHLEDVCREPPSPGSAKVFGDIPVDQRPVQLGAAAQARDGQSCGQVSQADRLHRRRLPHLDAPCADHSRLPAAPACDLGRR